MTDNHFPFRDRLQKSWQHGDSGDEVQYLLRAEEQVLQLISAHAPMQEVLHKICNTLNADIGNMISVICVANDEDISLAVIAKSAALFSLHKFCSAGVVGGNGELLGSLEMYSCIPRRPFLREVKLMERATCLAALAIKCYDERIKCSAGRIQVNPALRTNVLEWPT
jgi:hypothetical protein